MLVPGGFEESRDGDGSGSGSHFRACRDLPAEPSRLQPALGRRGAFLDRKRDAGQHGSELLDLSVLESMTSVAKLSDVFDLGKQIVSGKIKGRIVIDVNSI